MNDSSKMLADKLLRLIPEPLDGVADKEKKPRPSIS